MKRASILINNYNYAAYIKDCIQSALDQDYPAKEIIVVDDGSTDASREAILSFGDVVVPIFKSNGGQASAFNAGFAASTGDVIFFLDADDCFFPDKVRMVMQSYERSDIGWCHDRVGNDPSAHGVVDGADRMVDARAGMVRGVFPELPVPTSALSFRRDVLAQILPMPTAEDVVLSDNYLKFASSFLAPGQLLSRVLTFQRLHQNNRYTQRADAWRLRAAIMRETGQCLAQRYPELRRLGMELVAGGLSDSRMPASVVRDHLRHLDESVFGPGTKLRCLLLIAKKKIASLLRRRILPVPEQKYGVPIGGGR
jgi:glycosyltransferase involved in cell wall biosynthesis